MTRRASLYVGISHLKPEGNQIVADRLFDILEHPAGSSSGKRFRSGFEHVRGK